MDPHFKWLRIIGIYAYNYKNIKTEATFCDLYGHIQLEMNSN